MSAVLVVVGAAGMVAGTALLCWPAALIVGGLLFVLAGIDLRS